MDYQPTSSYDDKHSSGFAIASLILGIIAIVTCCCLYTALPCGALAIIFALLSRGGEMSFSTNAKIGLILGSIGLLLVFAIYIFAIVFALISAGSLDQFLYEYEQQLQQYPYMGQF